MGYEYTQPRGPIAAQYKSPGPVYSLPGLTGAVGHDPRSTHGKNPSWQFGDRTGKDATDQSPGPVYNLPPNITKQGKDGTPQWSLYARHKDLKRWEGPPPGAYSPEKAGPSASPRSPIYSFGSRTQLRTTDKNPAPNAYTLPSLLGPTVTSNMRSSPMIAQKGRSKTGGFSEDLMKTPGPGTYGVTEPGTYRHRSPSYSLYPRTQLPGDGTLKPGPGAHSPERVTIHQRASPRHTFGIRHSEYVNPLIVDVQD